MLGRFFKWLGAVALLLLFSATSAYGAQSTTDLSRLILSLTSRQGALKLIDKKLARRSDAGERGELLIRRAELLTDVAQLQQHLADEGHAAKTEWKTPARAAVAAAREAAPLLGGTRAAHARFLAGRNLYELGDRAAALTELTPAARGAEKAESIAASLLSGEILNQQSRFEETIALLDPVWMQTAPKTKAYQTVGENLAWAHYNAKHYAEAVQILRRSYGDRVTPSGRAVLMHFLATATEEKTSGFSVAETVHLFQEMAPVQSDRAPLLQEYAKALATRHQGPPLLALAKEAADDLGVAGVYDLRVRAIGACGEVGDLACVDHELQSLRGEKAALAQAFPSDEHRATYRKILESSANRLAARLRKSSPTLAAAYELALVFAPREKSGEARLQYNAGEASYQAQAYEDAVAHYRKAAELGDRELRERASLRAVAARYAGFQAQKRVPSDLQAVSADKVTAHELDAAAGEWIEWVEHLPEQETGIAYRFEAYRLLYAQGHVEEACRKLQALAEKFPSARAATKAAALVVDSDLAARNWDRAADRIARFLKQKAWENSPFRARLVELGPQVAHQRILAAIASGDSTTARKVGESALANLPPTAALASVGEQLGNLILAGGDAEAARAAYQKASTLSGGNGLATRLRARTELAQALAAENRFAFSESTRHYLKLLSAGPEVFEELGLGGALGTRMLETAWRAGERAPLQTLLDDKTVCAEKLAKDCGRYRALLASQFPEPGQARAYLDRAEKTEEATTRFAYATAAMEGGASLSVAQKLRLIGLLVPPTEAPLALRAALLSRFETFLDQTSQAIAQGAPVKLERAALARRREWIDSFAKALTAFDDTNVAPAKTAARLQRAQAFAAFAAEISALPVPAGLTNADREAYAATLAKRSAPLSDLAREYAQSALEDAWALPGSVLSTRIWKEYAKAHPTETGGQTAARGLSSETPTVLSGLPVFSGGSAALALGLRDALTARHFAGAAAVLDGLRQSHALRDGEEDYLNAALALAAGDSQLASQAWESARTAGRDRACLELARIYTASAQADAMRALGAACEKMFSHPTPGLPSSVTWATPIVAKQEDAK